jgi:hypothetical protein
MFNDDELGDHQAGNHNPDGDDGCDGSGDNTVQLLAIATATLYLSIYLSIYVPTYLPTYLPTYVEIVCNK